MRRIIMFGLTAVLALGMLTLGAAPAQAGGVAYTFSVASLGPAPPGAASGGGGVLFDGGAAGGHVAFSANGQLIFHLHPESWSVFAVIGSLVFLDVCFTAHDIKGVSGFPPATTICITDPGGPGAVLVTGGPVFMDVDGDGKADSLLRITPVN